MLICAALCTAPRLRLWTVSCRRPGLWGKAAAAASIVAETAVCVALLLLLLLLLLRKGEGLVCAPEHGGGKRGPRERWCGHAAMHGAVLHWVLNKPKQLPVLNIFLLAHLVATTAGVAAAAAAVWEERGDVVRAVVNTARGFRGGREKHTGTSRRSGGRRQGRRRPWRRGGRGMWSFAKEQACGGRGNLRGLQSVHSSPQPPRTKGNLKRTETRLTKKTRVPRTGVSKEKKQGVSERTIETRRKKGRKGRRRKTGRKKRIVPTFLFGVLLVRFSFFCAPLFCSSQHHKTVCTQRNFATTRKYSRHHEQPISTHTAHKQTPPKRHPSHALLLCV